MSDLQLRLDPALGRRAALEAALRTAVRNGILRAGTQLPSSRILAQDLGLSRGTVVEAYTQLSAEGYLITRPRSGTRVAEARSPRPPQPGRALRTEPRYDLRPISPDVASFPRTAWLRATREVLGSAPAEGFRYGHPAGDPALRHTLAAYLGRSRGVVTDPEQIVVCNGFSHALSLISRVLAESGADQLAMEDPGLLPSVQTARHAGMQVTGLPVDEGGLRVSELPAATSAVLITPAHHLPSGVTMSAQRRAELLRWVGPGRLILEDDYDGEFWHDQQPVAAVQGLCPERVVYLGTASKSLAPGLRLAWMALPPELVGPVIELRRHTDRHTATLPALTLARLIDSGAFDRHLRRMRAQYRRRRDRVVEALRTVPGVRLGSTSGGYHLTAFLPESACEEGIVEYLRQADVAVQGLGEYRVGMPAPPALVIGYAAPPGHLFEAAVEALVEALRVLPEGSRVDRIRSAPGRMED